MKIKSTVAGIIVATTMIAAGSSQAAVCSTCAKCSTCGVWDVPVQYSGTGWHMVPCNTYLPTARTWQQYTSGSYAPPEARSRFFFLGL